jgi:hexosaminidase
MTKTLIIPRPRRYERQDGGFVLDPDTKIFIVKGTAKGNTVGGYAVELVVRATGIKPTVSFIDDDRPRHNAILLTTRNAPRRLGAEGYRLEVKPRSILICAVKPVGLFYGLQSLRQLLPAEIERRPKQSRAWKVPCGLIEDSPRFSWRGMHLDVCRHFFGPESVKKYLDLLALHKMNVFHWHLTEDQGWRIEIRKYSKLTRVGAWRDGTCRHYPRGGKDTRRHGGYFTQDQVREIVAYAAERFITVVPEIEMPGHCRAAIAAYPELGCTERPCRVYTGLAGSIEAFCAGKDRVFDFLQDVLAEVMDLFPGRYLHIGGDEVNKKRWRACPKCQRRMRDEGLADEDALQSYFIARIAKYVHSQGRRIIGWGEILDGGLPPQAAVMTWQGVAAGIEAARMGHPVVIAPWPTLYFDTRPVRIPDYSGPGLSWTTNLKTVYDFDPTDGFRPAEQRNILGAQGCLWTEFVNNQEELEYMLLPRLAAVAEMTWSPREARDWDDFSRRLRTYKKRLRTMGHNYCVKLD